MELVTGQPFAPIPAHLTHKSLSMQSPAAIQEHARRTYASSAGLGFLGLGAQPPIPEWGAILSRGCDYLTVALHISMFPGLAIMLVILGFNLLGDGLLDVQDPRT